METELGIDDVVGFEMFSLFSLLLYSLVAVSALAVVACSVVSFSAELGESLDAVRFGLERCSLEPPGVRR